MARIFITGSADGLGELTATLLLNQGHEVVLHARNAKRGEDAMKKNPAAASVLTGDLSNIEEVKRLAESANKKGQFDAVIHNAGINRASRKDILTVNTLAPYVLTALMEKPARLIYLSSGMHLSGRFNSGDFKTGNAGTIYSDSKLYVLMFAFAVARKWEGVYSNAVNPGWVPTKMGGHGAPDDLQEGVETQSWLAVSNDDNAKVSGKYFFHQKAQRHNPEADDVQSQQKLLDLCEALTGVSFPG